MQPIKILNIVKKDMYEVREEVYSGKEYGMDEDTTLMMAYTSSGDFIGEPDFAKFLCEKHGIYPEKSAEDHTVCSIGWSEREQKYYGWSHRAIYGFKIGDVVKEGDCAAAVAGEEHLSSDRSLPVGFVAKTKDDCRKMAIAFADSVS